MTIKWYCVSQGLCKEKGLRRNFMSQALAAQVIWTVGVVDCFGLLTSFQS